MCIKICWISLVIIYFCVPCVKECSLYVLKHEISLWLTVLVWFLCHSDKIKPADVGLEQEAQLVRNWTASTQGPNGRRGRNGQYLPPIKYLHIHESESFSVRTSVFFHSSTFVGLKRKCDNSQFSYKGPKKFHMTLYDFTLAKLQATHVIIKKYIQYLACVYFSFLMEARTAVILENRLVLVWPISAVANSRPNIFQCIPLKLHFSIKKCKHMLNI